MPIEIRELVIKATVESQGQSGGGGGAAGGGGPDAKQRQQIVAECVEQVMEIIRQKSER